MNISMTETDAVASTATEEETTDTITSTTNQFTSERSLNSKTIFLQINDSDVEVDHIGPFDLNDNQLWIGFGVGFAVCFLIVCFILLIVLLIRKVGKLRNVRLNSERHCRTENGTYDFKRDTSKRRGIFDSLDYSRVADSDGGPGHVQNKRGSGASKESNVFELTLSSESKPTGIPVVKPRPRSKGKNVKFYKNEQKSKPDGWYIEEMLQKLKGNNQKLEDNHGYVQWLFPNKEKGVNWQADPITDAELRDIKSDPFCRERFVRAYAMMLQFYGIDLVDREIGTLRIRQDYRERCDNMQRHTHNYLRITRIIKALGLFGFEQYQETLIYHLVDAVKTGELSEPGAKRSLKTHWIPSVCNPDLRDTLMNDN